MKNHRVRRWSAALAFLVASSAGVRADSIQYKSILDSHSQPGYVPQFWLPPATLTSVRFDFTGDGASAFQADSGLFTSYSIAPTAAIDLSVNGSHDIGGTAADPIPPQSFAVDPTDYVQFSFSFSGSITYSAGTSDLSDFMGTGDIFVQVASTPGFSADAPFSELSNFAYGSVVVTYTFSYPMDVVPEPSSLTMGCIGIVAALMVARRRNA
ncbi:hypothetical protein OJF2_60870 [Aquisphaera giovannonii]|uniref:Ice-binding protein C-terminal domain-containing protein n=1 Tax=Aquisphaera giovannonii TaxID=406548 RepID=A0A5B9WAD5_9BACT|nr:PEP-CTERM sorting domain-containing protein [Aquisphaera giovannonii]QEH37496.1 hypothetical protein OJF2_60870 [Aquisphaera giovannonii]